MAGVSRVPCLTSWQAAHDTRHLRRGGPYHSCVATDFVECHLPRHSYTFSNRRIGIPSRDRALVVKTNASGIGPCQLFYRNPFIDLDPREAASIGWKAYLWMP